MTIAKMNIKSAPTPAKIGNRIGKTMSPIPKKLRIATTRSIGIMIAIHMKTKIRGLGDSLTSITDA
jgi:hypothetical protein